MTVRVWGEKKWESLLWEGEGAKKIMFSMTTNEDNIYRRCDAWESVFQKKKIAKQPIKNKLYFY